MRLPQASIIRRDLGALLVRFGETADDATLDRLVAHLRLLSTWNARYKLTSLLDWSEILDRHVGESILPLRWIGPTGSLVDIGSGNGFPALPILACRTEVRGLLIERSEKKSLFLEAASREMGLANVSVKNVDVQKLGVSAHGADRGGGGAERFTHVISRAALHPEEYLALASRLVAPGGRVHLFGGGVAAADAERLAPSLRLRVIANTPIPARRDSLLLVLESVP